MHDTTFLAYQAPTSEELLGHRLLRPGSSEYDAARHPWNLNGEQQPAAVVMAETADDVQAAVLLAARENRGVGVMATGHGVASPWAGGILVNTSRMRQVTIDPVARRARVGAAARWHDLVPAAALHGLAGLPGSSTQVGVVGYSLGGGFGWLGRRFGFAADSIRQARVVTATGDLVTASATSHADLFWGLAGGAGNFGIVVELEIELHPVSRVLAGNLYYPLDRARSVLELFAAWGLALPDEMSAAATFRAFPPLPTVPAPLRGRSFVAVRGCYSGEDLEVGRYLVATARDALGPPEIDTFAEMPVSALDAVSMDPVDPLGARGHSEMLRGLSRATIDALAEVAGPDAGSPLVMVELRRLGGALSPRPGRLSPLGRSEAAFSLNAIGITPTAKHDRAVRLHLERVARAVAADATGTTYVNFLDLDGATPDRVRAAYAEEDWRRLVALKDRWDPQNRFRFNRNIPPTAAAPPGSIPVARPTSPKEIPS